MVEGKIGLAIRKAKGKAQARRFLRETRQARLLKLREQNVRREQALRAKRQQIAAGRVAKVRKFAKGAKKAGRQTKSVLKGLGIEF